MSLDDITFSGVYESTIFVCNGGLVYGMAKERKRMVYFKFVKQQNLIKLYYYPSRISVSQRNLVYLIILESEYINSLLELFRSRMMT
jgi:hypothetical protein